MGLQEAIACGIPMIGIPLFADQYSNIKNVAEKKVAISLDSMDNITEEKLTSALNNILKDPSYRWVIERNAGYPLIACLTLGINETITLIAEMASVSIVQRQAYRECLQSH